MKYKDDRNWWTHSLLREGYGKDKHWVTTPRHWQSGFYWGSRAVFPLEVTVSAGGPIFFTVSAGGPIFLFCCFIEVTMTVSLLVMD